MDISSLDHHKKKVNLEALDLEDLFSKVAKTMTDKARDHGIHFTAEDVPDNCRSVWADKEHLKQSFIKLAYNGIKYNTPEGTVKLTAESGTNNLIRINVTDTGIGIPDSKIDRLFSPFDRLDAERETPDIQGTGLGLTLAHILITSMKGSISVSSKPGQGTRFTIELTRAS
jgi:signal transduction histidine kinase